MPSTRDESKPTFAATSLAERPTIVAEANLLRLPLFALRTRGLKQLDGFECRGTTTRGENTWEFLLRTARSTATLYPGLLSRSVHLAFLGIITEKGLPFANPVTWTWRNLCVRLGVQPSGQMVQHLKEAVEATAGLTIYSQDALYSKPAGQRFNTRKAMHLYETVVFVNETLPDGRTADTNYLWLSGWYLDNLNALFTAPLDHELWRYLDKRSPIASRLYEFLLINFHGGMPQLQINYPRLAQFLPVRQERYLSDARKQLEPAFKLLTETRVAESVTWHKRREDVAQLRFARGTRLLQGKRGESGSLQSSSATTALVSVREVRRTPEQDLVREFYRLWTGRTDQHPNSADLTLAKRIIADYGRSQAIALLPSVIEQLKRYWPGAKTFVAVEQYMAAAAETYQSRQRRDKQRQQQQETERRAIEHAESQSAERHEFEAIWEPFWGELPAGEQAAIRDRVLSVHPFMRHTPHELQFRCLQELAQRETKPSDVAPETGESDLRTVRNPRL
ncbi:MAG: hypothetical protein JWP89_1645 [Schlesneria sp.]|nr:hypothetical protein [Schlesneria sp.]